MSSLPVGHPRLAALCRGNTAWLIAFGCVEAQERREHYFYQNIYLCTCILAIRETKITLVRNLSVRLFSPFLFSGRRTTATFTVVTPINHRQKSSGYSRSFKNEPSDVARYFFFILFSRTAASSRISFDVCTSCPYVTEDERIFCSHAFNWKPAVDPESGAWTAPAVCRCPCRTRRPP